MTEEWGGPKAEGRENLAPKGSKGQEGFTPKGPGISDLISSEYTHGLHLTNCRCTSSSLELSLGRIPECRTTKAKLETSHNFHRLNPINANRKSRRFSRAVQTVGMLSISSWSAGLYSQLRPLTKKIMFLSVFVGGWKIRDD